MDWVVGFKEKAKEKVQVVALKRSGEQVGLT